MHSSPKIIEVEVEVRQSSHRTKKLLLYTSVISNFVYLKATPCEVQIAL